MFARPWQERFSRRAVMALTLAAAAFLLAPAASANELDKLDTSLKLIPADAAFYSNIMRGRELFDILRQSNVWKKVEQLPLVQMGVTMYRSELDRPDSDQAKLQMAMQNPEVKKVIDMVVDMLSHDVFVYGDKSNIELTRLVQNTISAMRYGPIVLQANGEIDPADADRIQAKILLSTLAKHADAIQIPNIVFGYKVENVDLAKEQLIKLEMFGNLLESNEKTQGRFKKTTVGSSNYLVLSLDGEMVPWDELPMDELYEMELEEGDVDTVVDKLKELKLVVAVGLHDNYLICSVGSSLECLEKLGQGDRLIDSDEFKPIAKFADARIVSLAYLSAEMNRQLNNEAGKMQDLLEMVDKLLPLADLTEEQEGEIRSDAQELVEDIKDYLPEIGATSAVGLLTERGIENYGYNWGKWNKIDGGSPLGLLQHIGGNPLLAVLSRSKGSMADYDMFAKWAVKAYGYFEEYALPRIPEEEREKVDPLLEGFLPLIARMDQANRRMLIPALADGQSALVIDAKLTSKQFHVAMPATDEPMPMVEPAVVLGVSDAKLLQEGLAEYRTIINEMIDVLRGIEDMDIPASVKIPEPQKTETTLGTFYTFPLPAEWGVDGQIVPTIAVSNNTAVFCMTKTQAERILTATPPALGGVLENAEKPRAAVVRLDWAAVVDAATPWVDFAIDRVMAEKGVTDRKKKQVADQIHVGLDVLQALRNVTCELSIEDGVMVHHTLLEIHDVE